MRRKLDTLFLALLLAAAFIIGSQKLSAQVATMGLTTVTQLTANQSVTAGVTQTATITAASGKYTCLQDALVTLDVPTSGTVGVSGTVTLSDGTITIGMLCIDTFTSGAWCEYYGPVLQSTSTAGTWTVTVPAFTNGGAGNVHVLGYSNPGQC